LSRPRLEAVRKMISEAKVDALLVTHPVNRRYLSGFDGSSGLLLISLNQAYLITDFRYLEQAEKQAEGFTIIRRHDELYPGLAAIITENGWNSIGFEAKELTYDSYREMEEKLKIKWVPLTDTVEKLRMVKNDAELAIMNKGAAQLDEAFSYLLTLIKPGMSERQLALELEIFLLRAGAEERSFKFIVASGPRGALPHGSASEKIMQAGELVTIDFGAVFEAYATDMTRTVCLGRPDQLQSEIYELVQKAQAAAAAAVAPQKKTREIDSVARDIIEKAGYGEYFGHGLGHGIGLETHEAPTLNQRNETVLEPGMVVTIEPGVYLPGQGGVRIEDMVQVTVDGVRNMTTSTRELIII
jgi:Xaa-Pro aminopeptidase